MDLFHEEDLRPLNDLESASGLHWYRKIRRSRSTRNNSVTISTGSSGLRKRLESIVLGTVKG